MRKARIMLAIAGVIILTGFGYLAINSGVTAQRLNFKTIKLQSTEQKLKNIDIQYQKLNVQMKTQTSMDKQQMDSLKSQQDKLQKEKQDLEAQLQAKAAEKAKLQLAAAQVEQTVTAQQTVAAAPVVSAALPSGTHTDWMAQAGIAPSDYGYVDYIVMREGHYDPCVVNGGAHDCSYATSGGQRAYGVCQALPGSKMASAGADWATNPITQLRWCASYAARYGGWAGAYNAWIAQNWW